MFLLFSSFLYGRYAYTHINHGAYRKLTYYKHSYRSLYFNNFEHNLKNFICKDNTHCSTEQEFKRPKNKPLYPVKFWILQNCKKFEFYKNR